MEAAKEADARLIELKKLDLELARANVNSSLPGRRKSPRLPAFVDGYELDNYLLRFERYANVSKWEKAEWATTLSTLLTGRALEVYSRLSEDEAKVYDLLKQALLKRYDLTEEGYRVKFRSAHPHTNESSSQFVIRLKTICRSGWIWLSAAPIGRKFGNY